jgi:NAD(P)-dependent dehydrogenase (short-subunit alcohol dehydrogenase family)
MIMRRHDDPVIARFVHRDDLDSLAAAGPLTPDHVIRTKPFPQVGLDVARFASAYREYVARHRHRSRTEVTELDPAPRVILHRQLGMLTVGRSAAAAEIAADIYHHTIPVLERAADHLGGYHGLAPGDLFDMEYWDLEQAKLKEVGAPRELAGSVALVTGAGSGIGHACAAELMERGAAVAGLDRDDSVVDAFDGPAWFGVVGDVTVGRALRDSLAATVERFGGIDILVVAAGIFGSSHAVSGLPMDEWRRVMAVNVDAVAELFSLAHPLLARSPIGGRVIVIGSKNVIAPGKGAAAYSASKAALNQLTRIAALEWAADGIRVNAVHPDAVFDTGLWTEDLLDERAAHHGLTVDQYRRRNLLGIEITSAQVARTAVTLCTDAFTATTGAQVPVDGGNERVI